jgi:pimeloyl-ACP methyl ester carboxylesterase
MIIQPTLHHFPLVHRNNKRMAYWQWGNSQADHVIVCVHGLTRQGRDFDVLAKGLLDAASSTGVSIRIVCVDIIGRGQSDWLGDGKDGVAADSPMGYAIPLYAQDMSTFLAALHSEHAYTTLDWVGTSMGGLIAMGVIGGFGIGAVELPIPVRRLVLNDVGPALEWSSLVRIGSYLGRHSPNVGIWETEQQGADAIWHISSSFGPHSKNEWLALSRPQMKQCTDGKYTLAYDPAIGELFKMASRESTAAGEGFLWQLYEDITAKTLITRGLESDLLSTATAAAMIERGKKMPVPAKLVEFEGVGHAPTFVAKNQHSIVCDFLIQA